MSDPGGGAEVTGRKADIAAQLSAIEATADSRQVSCDFRVLARRRHSVFLIRGRHFGPDRLSVAKKTVENFVARVIRRYEQEPGEAEACARLGLYVRQWVRWAHGDAPRGPCEMAGGDPIFTGSTGRNADSR